MRKTKMGIGIGAALVLAAGLALAAGPALAGVSVDAMATKGKKN